MPNAVPSRAPPGAPPLIPIGLLALALDLAAGDRYAPAIASSRSALRHMVESGRTPGVAAAVAIHGRVVWTEGFGFANLEHGVAASADTLFGIGSISKALTATAAVKLADRGLVDLDAPIERYLADFPHRGRGVTLRRTFVHQSGLSDQFATAHYETTKRFPTLQATYERMRDAPLTYAPGTRTAYATGVYTLIGHALERATGRSYDGLMRDEVFGPAGLGIVPNDRRALIPQRTGFYANREGGGFEDGPFTDPSHKLPRAGFLATARDVAAFGAALLAPSFLSERARRELFTAVPLADGSRTEFAPGSRVGSDGLVLHLPGGGIGISSWLFIHPEEQLVIALLANVNTAPVGGHAYRWILEAFRKTR